MVKNYLNPTEGPQIEAEMLLVSRAPTDKVVWTIGACYRPEVDQDQILDKICCAINNINTQNVILMGDFNFKNINWETGECTSAREQKFLDTLQDIKHILEDIEVTPDMVRKKLTHLKANKANGPDDISTNVIRKCPDLDQPLNIIFNLSI